MTKDGREIMRRIVAPAVPICPRCGGYIPNAETPGAYPGALSRVDNKTEICSKCGSEEVWVSTDDYAGWKTPPNVFDSDVEELIAAERVKIKECSHAEWNWLDCEECKETIGLCGEKVCTSCGASVE
jgi:hypothetical protein